MELISATRAKKTVFNSGKIMTMKTCPVQHAARKKSPWIYIISTAGQFSQRIRI